MKVASTNKPQLNFFKKVALTLAAGVVLKDRLVNAAPVSKTAVGFPRGTTQALATPHVAAFAVQKRQSPVEAQFEGMISQQEAALVAESAQSTQVAGQYAQAGISAPVSSAFAPADLATQPAVASILTFMENQYAQTGSPDLSPQTIKATYADALQQSEKLTGVPAAVTIGQIYTESKGNPLVSNGGLTQIDPVTWGQAADQNTALTNRYDITSNIVASAMKLKQLSGGLVSSNPQDWAGALSKYATDPDYVTKVLANGA